MLDRILIGSSAEPSDPNFKNVTLLLHGDGSNGAQNNTFIDSSTNNFTITRNGNTTQGSFSPYGSNWGCYFDGTSDYLTYTGGSSLNFGTGDFTIELFVFLENTGTYSPFLRPDASTTTPEFGYDFSSGQLKFDQRNGPIVAVTTTMPTNQWAHVAVSRSGTSLRLFINGAQVGSTVTNSTNWTSPSGDIRIGGSSFSSTHNVKGYISNFRVLNGTALYTGSYTVPTAPLTAITNTSLLTCAYNRFRDGSTNNFTITRNGDVKVTNFAPFAPSSAYSATTNGGSAYFDGSGDYLTASYTTANFDWYTSGTDFTIEAWFYANTLTNISYPNGGFQSPVMCGNRDPNSGTDYWGFGPTSEGLVALYYWNGAANRIASTSSIVAGCWNHVAMTKTSSGVTLFVNGVAQTTSAISGTPQSSTSVPFAIGQAGSSSYSFPGYITNVRVVRGTAVYSGNFTPPTTPLTAVTNTKYLLNATNAAIFDNSMKNDLETVGNAQISTSVKKFGTGSMYFDGNGDYLTPASRDAGVFGTGDFTVECWVYATGAPQSNQVIWNCNQYPNTTGLYLAYYGSGSTQISVAGGGSSYINASGGWSLNEWHHVAVVRSGSTMTLYIDGTSRGSTTFTNNCSDGLVFIGRPYDVANYMMQGYIDELRITKGVARYTANFTPPTAPFPNK